MAGTATSAVAGTAFFSLLSDDITLNIFLKLESDPRDFARLACVCTRFSTLIRDVCYRAKCFRSIPSVVSDLLSTSSALALAPRPVAAYHPGGASAAAAEAADPPPGGWAALHKLAICCPGLLHAGVLLENSDFGLERDIGPDENYRRVGNSRSSSSSSSLSSSSSCDSTAAVAATADYTSLPPLDCTWSLFDDLYFDTVYDVSESQAAAAAATIHGAASTDEEEEQGNGESAAAAAAATTTTIRAGREISRKRRKTCEGPKGTHLASGGAWNLSREQGNKLLASRFRGDCLYICDWPGCVHADEKRNYMLFRGVFKNFKRSRVWRTINDGSSRSRIALDCAFCACRETWDLHSAFCLRRVFGYHDDGEPVVRAYVCVNGHVSGAWTERPMYT